VRTDSLQGIAERDSTNRQPFNILQNSFSRQAKKSRRPSVLTLGKKWEGSTWAR
jgi:hypothetical protein